MNQTDNHNSPISTSQRKGLPWPFIIIVAVIVLPIVAAYVAYYTGMGVSDETVNKGELLEPPVPFSALATQAEDSESVELQGRRWRMLIPVTVPCDAGCQQNLYTTRQVYIRLGEKNERVERIAVNLAEAEGEAYLAEIEKDHPHLRDVSVELGAWQAWLADTNAPTDLQKTPYYLLVDQEGIAMMYYTADHHGNDLLDDIKRLLRYTPE